MQKTHFFKLSLLLMLPFLSGCKENRTDLWYMQHPMELKKELMQCQSREQIVNQTSCERLLAIAENVQAIINEQQSHPEAFGQRIMDEQNNLIKTRVEMQQAEKKLTALKQHSASDTQIRAAQDDLYKTRKLYTEQEQQIKTLLAIVALTRP